MFALQMPEEVKTKRKRNQTLDWRGHTTARKKKKWVDQAVATKENGKEGGCMHLVVG